MKPVDFPGRNFIYSKDDARYLPLPAHCTETCTTTCWELTWPERFAVLFSGRLWLQQLNFSEPLQPQKPQVVKPAL